MKAMDSRVSRLVRAIALNGALITASVVAALLFAEVAVRLFAPQQLILIEPELWQPDDTVGWVRRPHVDLTVNTGERPVRVITDQHGLRVGQSGRSEGTPLLLLGDSFMEALQVEHEQSFAGLLEERLSSGHRPPVAVRNAGVAGFNPNQYLLRARSLLPLEEQPLVLTMVYVGNDVVSERVDRFPARPRARRHRFRIPRSFQKAEFVSAILRPMNDFLEVRSHLYILVRSGLEGVRMRLGLHALAFPEQYLVQEEETPRWGVTADILSEIQDLAEKHGARTLFVLVPSPIQVAPEALDTYLRGYGIAREQVDLDQPNRLLSAELRKRGLEVLDVLPAFRRAADAGVQVYGDVDPHLSPDGHRVLVDAVVPTVERMLPDVSRARPEVSLR